jgi:serine/threonine protein kinase
MKVYRCYDNRLRCTERRPDLYESFVREENGLEGKGVVLHVTDTAEPSDAHPFGQPMPQSYINIYDGDMMKANLDWIWKFKGQLKVITTPYHNGVHYATLPNQFVPIVDYLERMHANGYVHGDIRAYNMVLNYENSKDLKGWLIDFDFGGRIDESPKYPSGYVKSLDDGFRRGEPGETITVEDDWFALGQVIFQCYSLDHKNKSSVFQELGQLVSLQDEFKSLIRMRGSLVHKAAAKALRDYLSLAVKNSFEFVLEDCFEESLKQCNQVPRTKSNGATGSPPKPKN